ncbi:nuclear membrane organization protein Apq12 [Schizosaccharomyces pombe]|uniref:Nuclear membrane organization protein apq12 n=1 Tax=Schizosaccharomyces pombe (strain 972 / ATCC 24843) TaxID=284812 RepID=APQ12_SCHPO|nr:putative nuclear membrane organization protein Apq12 [Schizosaccharomyces pombe]O94353.1 RecName: Full=Nuclear membrane organization protein apq12 [Schizosaccharomyces pombe 972h-]CAA22279.1 nuclear membrane organization protein Apq12 (predicted) [Schizosaccharomyces pombe]|eukprot:NP_595182.1 putative nuclear membrane organization protein Apq12 [Schizosaccharomyces pombe]
MSLTSVLWNFVAKLAVDHGLNTNPDQVFQTVENVGKSFEKYETSFLKSLFNGNLGLSLPSAINILTLIIVLYFSLVIVNKTTSIALALFKTLAVISFFLLIGCLFAYWFINNGSF